MLFQEAVNANYCSLKAARQSTPILFTRVTRVTRVHVGQVNNFFAYMYRNG